MAKQKSIITGTYRITSMEMSDQDFVDADVPGYIHFAKDGLGDFQFGYVRCDLDWREKEHDGNSAVEFTFEGMDEMDPTSGRGSAIVTENELDGMIFFHRGDESGFKGRRA